MGTMEGSEKPKEELKKPTAGDLFKDGVYETESGDKIYETTRDKMVADYKKRKDRWFIDIENTPCARNSFINGILGGITVGLLYFLKSNQVARSCDIAVGGFAVVTYGSWRYYRQKMYNEYFAIQSAMETKSQNPQAETQNPEAT